MGRIRSGSFGDSGDPFREKHFTRKACAELLLDAGAVVVPRVCDGLIRSRARGLIELFHRRGLLPRTLKFFAALGDIDGIRACLDTKADDLAAVNEAFMYACHLQHATAAALLLDRSITLDAELGRRIWPLPDDLPHAAGSGDLARVRGWFDAAGRPALGDLANHFPANDDWIRGNLKWGEPTVQQVLDTALAWSVINNHFDIADFLLEHGADINTDWSSHEPASILHELVWYKNYEAMKFLIDRGIDMTIRDYRWDATAVGWAAVAAKDEKLAQWMRDAEQRRNRHLSENPL